MKPPIKPTQRSRQSTGSSSEFSFRPSRWPSRSRGRRRTRAMTGRPTLLGSRPRLLCPSGKSFAGTKVLESCWPENSCDWDVKQVRDNSFVIDDNVAVTVFVAVSVNVPVNVAVVICLALALSPTIAIAFVLALDFVFDVVFEIAIAIPVALFTVEADVGGVATTDYNDEELFFLSFIQTFFKCQQRRQHSLTHTIWVVVVVFCCWLKWLF